MSLFTNDAYFCQRCGYFGKMQVNGACIATDWWRCPMCFGSDDGPIHFIHQRNMEPEHHFSNLLYEAAGETSSCRKQ